MSRTTIDVVHGDLVTIDNHTGLFGGETFQNAYLGEVRALYQPTGIQLHIPEIDETPLGVDAMIDRLQERHTALISASDWAQTHSAIQKYRQKIESLNEPIELPEWRDTAQLLLKWNKAAKWNLADWLILGQRLFGEDATSFWQDSGVDYESVKNYLTVARKIPYELRNPSDNISWSHHAALTGLCDPQRYPNWRTLVPMLLSMAAGEYVAQPKDEPVLLNLYDPSLPEDSPDQRMRERHEASKIVGEIIEEGLQGHALPSLTRDEMVDLVRPLRIRNNDTPGRGRAKRIHESDYDLALKMLRDLWHEARLVKDPHSQLEDQLKRVESYLNERDGIQP